MVLWGRIDISPVHIALVLILIATPIFQGVWKVERWTNPGMRRRTQISVSWWQTQPHCLDPAQILYAQPLFSFGMSGTQQSCVSTALNTPVL